MIKIYAPVEEQVHKKLVALAEDRKMPLYRLVQEILIWAGEKSAQEIIGQGVNLPIYAGEIESSNTCGSQ